MPVPEAALVYVAKLVLEQLESELGTAATGRVKSWLRRDPQRMACAVALARTEARFAALHPGLHASQFDGHFLKTAAAPLLAQSLTRGVDATAEALAEAWEGRLPGTRSTRDREMATPAAADLLAIWREELGRHDVFRPILDSAALDRIADAGRPAELERMLLRARYPDLEDDIHWPSRTAARSPVELSGREWVFKRLETLTAGSRGAYVHIVAEAGLGKTALATEIASRRDAPLFLFGAGHVSTDRCLRHLCVELIHRGGLAHTHLPAGTGEDAGMLTRLLEEAAPTWIVIDGLDEADGLPLPEALPDGVYILLTHRPGNYGTIVQPGTDVRELRIQPNDERQLDDVAEFLRAHVDDPTVRHALLDASEGNFMYLAYSLDDLREGEFSQHELPRGLNGYYGHMWDAIAVESDAWDEVRRPVIELLAIAGEPVTLAWLAALTGRTGPEIQRRALKPWRRFLREEDGAWRIVHQSFRTFLETTDELDLPAAHAMVAAHCRAHRDDYAVRFLTMHLFAAGDADTLFELVLADDWRGAQLLADPSGALYRADVDRAWDAAFAIDHEALQAGSEPLDLMAEIVFAVFASDLHAFALTLPPELLLRLLEAGEWTPGQVLGAALARHDPAERVAALTTILPGLDGDARARALAAVGELADPEPDAEHLENPYAPTRLEAMIALSARGVDASLERAFEQTYEEVVQHRSVVMDVAARIPEPLLGAALAPILRLDDGFERAHHLADLAPRLSGPLAEAALTSANALEDADERAVLRAQLGLALPAAERAAAVDRAFAAVEAADDVYTRANRLERLGALLPTEHLQRAMELTREVASDADAAFMAADVLVALAPRLDAGQAREAFALASALRSPRALLALAPRLPDDLVVPAFEAAAEWDGTSEALAALASRLPDNVIADALARCGPWEYPAVLATLAPRLSLDQLVSAIATAGAQWESVGPQVLAAVSPHLPADLLPAAVAAAGHTANRAHALSAIAPHLPEAVEPALQTATPDLFAHVAAEVAELLPPERREEVLQAALRTLEDLDPPQRTSAAVVLIPHLSGEQRARALDVLDPAELASFELEEILDELSDDDVAARVDALDPDDDFDVLLALAPRLTLADVLPALDPEYLADPLTELIPRLPEAERGRAIAAALDAARAIEYDFGRAEALAALLPFLPDDEGVRAEAATAAAACEDEQRPFVVEQIAPHLSEPRRSELLATIPTAAEAFAEICAAPDPYRVIREVPRLAPQLSHPERERAVELCASISDLDFRASALVELAPSLTGELRERALAAIAAPLHHTPPLESLAAVDAEAAAGVVELVTEPRARVHAVEQLIGAPAIDPRLLHAHLHVALRVAAAHGLAIEAIARLAPALGRLTSAHHDQSRSASRDAESSKCAGNVGGSVSPGCVRG